MGEHVTPPQNTTDIRTGNTMKTEVIYPKIESNDSLFYVPVMVQEIVELQALIDSGSMTCTLSESAEDTLLRCNVIKPESRKPTQVVLVGCGGNQAQPKYEYDLNIDLLDCKMAVSVLVVPGQTDDMIVGSNAIKHIMQQVKKTKWYWDSLSKPAKGDSHGLLLSMLANVNRWHGDKIPDKVGTVMLKQSVTLMPQHEHLVWGKLKEKVPLSVGSTVVIEATTARSAPRNVLVGRTVCPLRGDKWVPMKVINMLDHPIILRRNTKLADVHPCLALEDLELYASHAENPSKVQSALQNVTQAGEGCSFGGKRAKKEYLQKLEELGLKEVDIESCEVSDMWKGKLVDLIAQYEGIFSRDRLDCGEAKNVIHRIRLKDEKPFRLPYRRVSPSDYQKLRQTLEEMEERGIIRKSSSEWASPLVLVWKPSGELRICTDFRWLNQRTEKDAYPLPHQADALAALGGNCFFSTMDLTSGFYNIPIHEDDRKYTACTTPTGLFEYNRMAQGLCNSPATFARMMTSIFGDQNYLSLLCYLDDLLVFGKTEQEALDRLEMVFSRLKEHNLKLAQKKCYLLRKSVKFLGHIVTAEGIATDPGKVSAINDITAADLMENDGKTPSPTKVRSFLGMANYYSHFIASFSGLAKPLFRLIAGQKSKRKGEKGKPHGMAHKRLKPEDWTSECGEALEKLKAAVSQKAVLAHPDFNRPFLLSTDASMDGLGAVLSQTFEGESRPRPVAFASKTLSRSQSRYPAHRLEFFALKWAVCDKFTHWLKGNRFTVLTDNNPLTYIMTKPKLDACEQRWVSKLAPFDFDLKYIPGPQNVPADLLSRQPFVGARKASEFPEYVTSESIQDAFKLSVNIQGGEILAQVSSEGVKAVLESCLEWDASVPVRTFQLAQYSASILQHEGGVATLPVLSPDVIRRKQKADQVLARVAYFVERRRRPSRRERAHETAQVLRMLKHWDKLEIKDEILYRRSKDRVVKKRYQLVVPDSLKAIVLRGTHDEAGHQGQTRTLHLVRQRFFWTGMEGEVKKYVSYCKRCVVGKTMEPEARAPLESIQTSTALELVCIDFWSAEGRDGESVDVLVITDHFTKLAHAFPCPNQTAKVVAQKLWNQFFCVYGFPQRIHSDKGANFESHLIAELLQVSGVKKSHTTPYHPMGNGQTERFNRTLGNMVRSLPARAKERWPQMIQTLTFSYNCTTHETTGFAPFFLMFGRIPRLPVDIMFGSTLKNEDVLTHDEYVDSFQKDLREAVRIAQANTTEAQKKQARQYNKRVKGTALEIGDRVLLANRKERGKGKLADLWDSTVYVITWKDPSVHIYRVEDPTTKKSKVVHRNFILPVNFLPVGQTDEMSTVASTASEEDINADSGDERPVFDVDEDSEDRRTAVWILEGQNPEGPTEAEGQKSSGPEDGVNMREAAPQCPAKDMISGQAAKSSTGSSSMMPGDDSSDPSEDDTSREATSVSSLDGISSRSSSVSGSVCIRSTKKRMSNQREVERRNSQTSELTDTVLRPSEGTLRTRTGRVVKPVRRLLESMSQVIAEPDKREHLAALIQALSTFVEVTVPQ